MRTTYKNDGFTLVELMIVVGLVGVLASISISNYEKFVARARQSEAKIALAAVYASEKAFAAEFNSYTYCLKQAGFTPQGATQYYMVGSVGAAVLGGYCTNCGPNSDQSCMQTSWNPTIPCTMGTPATGGDHLFIPNARINPSFTNTALAMKLIAVNGGNCPDVSTTTFILQAVGSISSSSNADLWSIDQNRSLINVKSGI